MDKLLADGIADGREKIELLEKLDARGFFMRPNETFESFCGRVNALCSGYGKILDELSKTVDLTRPVPDTDKTAALDILENVYRVRPDWVRAFYSAKEVGRFSAGVQLEINGSYPVVFLHGSFAERRTRFLYGRDETLAHELAHAVRLPIGDSPFEEFFACQVHASGFRKFAGNFFGRIGVPILCLGLFLISETLLLLGMPLAAVVPFVCFCAVIGREMRFVRAVSKTLKLFKQSGYDALPMVLRLSKNEILFVAKNGIGKFEKSQSDSPRFEMLVGKFKIRHDS